MNINGELRLHLDRGSAVLRYSETPTSLSIDSLLVPADARGQGLGTALLLRVLLLADVTARTTFVSARPIGVSGAAALERLVRFYERQGFCETDRGLTVVYMRRRPIALAALDFDSLQSLVVRPTPMSRDRP